MAEALGPASTAAGDVAFTLDRFERTADGRLEIVGRWSGVRGRRFIRPSLSLGPGGEHRRLLADLEHKPWAAEDEQEWHAAFRLSAESVEVAEGAELSVAPDIAIELPAPTEPGGRRRRAKRAAKPSARVAEPEPVPDQLAEVRAELERVRAALTAALTQRDRLRAELDDVRGELDAARADLDAAVAQREAEAAERRGALTVRDAVVCARDAAAAERDAALAAANAAHAARQEAIAARDAAVEERDAAVARRDAAAAQLRTAIGERDAAAFERDAALSELNRGPAQTQPVARAAQSPPGARPLLGEREPAYTLPLMLTSSELPAVRRNVGWARRAAVIAVVVIMAIVVWLMIRPL